MDTWKKLMCLILISCRFRRRGPRFPDRPRSWGCLLQWSTSNDVVQPCKVISHRVFWSISCAHFFFQTGGGFSPEAPRISGNESKPLTCWQEHGRTPLRSGPFGQLMQQTQQPQQTHTLRTRFCFSTLQVDREKLCLVSLKMQKKIGTKVGTSEIYLCCRLTVRIW